MKKWRYFFRSKKLYKLKNILEKRISLKCETPFHVFLYKEKRKEGKFL